MENGDIRTAHLFAGGGGGILTDLILGHKPVCAIEIIKYRCDILKERKQDGWFPELKIYCGDIREFDFQFFRGRVDCISAGFPCQDISCAGPGAGIGGERSGLVREVFRAIDEIRPGLVFLENSPLIRTKGRDIIIRTLVEKGYSWRDGTLKAAHVGAGHRRNRWWCLAANADGLRKLEQERRFQKKRGWLGDGVKEIADATGLGFERGTNIAARNNTDRTDPGWEKSSSRLAKRFKKTADADLSRCEQGTRCKQEKKRGVGSLNSPIRITPLFIHQLVNAVELEGLSPDCAEIIEAAATYTGAINWSPPNAGVCRVVDGMANRVDRIKTLGDGQVPLQAAVAWALLAGWN